MTTFIKTKFNISDDQTNIDKYRLAANYNRKSYFIKIILTKNHYSCNNFPVERKKIWSKSAKNKEIGL